jgi:ATP-binding cassette subfamily B protein
LAVFGAFGVLYALMMRTLRQGLRANSDRIARESTNTIRYLQEGLGGIRDIILDHTQDTFVATFRRSDAALRKAQRENLFASQSPRFLMESAGMVLIALIALGFSRGEGGVTEVISMLAALALGLQRLLPALQQLYQSWSTIQGAQGSLRETVKLLEQPLLLQSEASAIPLRFDTQIELRHVGFRYAVGAPAILSDFSLVIRKGKRIGFIGETGSGKSTLLDIVMGLLHPSEGQMLVDGVPITADNVDAWRPHIAHVPQDLFLKDGTVRENIAFGVPPESIEDDGVRRAAIMAQIGPTIESWPDGYDTLVGERGVQLSGGQRQRIGIARALYKKADVFIFDEATSALDNVTEEAVMKSIESLNESTTVLIIAHRLSTLKNCNEIVELRRQTSVNTTIKDV